MKSLITKRSVTINGRLTSVSLEDAFWMGLQDIAASRNKTAPDLIRTINAERRHGNLSSAVRLVVLKHYPDRSKINDMLQKRKRSSFASQSLIPAYRP